MALLIGIAGRANSGKSTVADEMAARATYWDTYCEKYELSDFVLQDAINRGLLPSGISRQMLTTKEEIEVLIMVGEGRRAEDPEFWLKKLEADIALDRPQVVLVPNIRHRNENEWIKKRGGYIVKTTCLNKNGSERISLSRDPNSDLESQAGLLPADFYLQTKYGESDLLKLQARVLFDYIRAKHLRFG